MTDNPHPTHGPIPLPADGAERVPLFDLVGTRGVTGQLLTFAYTNYEGETAQRRVRPMGISFEATEWHPEPQWLLYAYDLDRCAMRIFAMRDVREVRYVD